jgi:hypothetical protein
MIRTTREQLGEAYRRASQVIMAMEPVTPRIMGALWREHFGLHHKYNKALLKDVEYWIEFPDERDYTAFMLRFA